MEMASSSGWSSALVGGADTIVARVVARGAGWPGADQGQWGVRPGSSPQRFVPVSIWTVVGGRRWSRSARPIGAVDRPGGGPPLSGAAVLHRRGHARSHGARLDLDRSGPPSKHSPRRAPVRPIRASSPAGRVANGKLDLVQAEAINELTSAETAWQARVARAQIEGRLSQRIRRARGRR